MKTQKLEVPFAFHSSQVDPILDDFEAAASSITFSRPTIPVISPLCDRTIQEDHQFGPSYLRRHCREPVNFVGALQSHVENFPNVDHLASMWLEIGPQPACGSMIKASVHDSHAIMSSLSRNQESYATLIQSIRTLYCAGTEIDWSEYHRAFESCVTVLPLPTYSFDEKNF